MNLQDAADGANIHHLDRSIRRRLADSLVER